MQGLLFLLLFAVELPSRTLGGGALTAPGKVLSVDWSNDGRLLAAGGFFKEIVVFDAETQQARHRIALQTNGFVVRFSPDSTKLAYGLEGDRLVVYDLVGSKVLLDKRMSEYSAQLNALAFADDESVFVGAAGRIVRVRIADGAQTLSIDGARGRLAVNDKWVAAFSDGVRLWDVKNGALLASAPEDNPLGAAGNGGMGIAFVGDTLHAAWTRAGRVQRYALPKLAAKDPIALYEPSFKSPKIGSVRARGDRVIVSTENAAHIIDGATIDGYAEDAVLSPDAKRAAIARGTALVMWPAVSAEEGHRGRVSSLAFCADGTLLSAGDDRTLRAWDTETGKQLWSKGYATAVGDGVVGYQGGVVETIECKSGVTGRPLAKHDAPIAFVSRGISVDAQGYYAVKGKLRRVSKSARGVEALAVADDGSFAIGVFSPTEETVQRFTAAGVLAQTMKTKSNHAGGLVFKGKELIIGGTGTVIAARWGDTVVMGGETLQAGSRQLYASGKIYALAVNHQWIAAAGDDGRIRLFPASR